MLAQLLTGGSCPHEKYWDHLARELFDNSHWAAEPQRNVFVLRIIVCRLLHFDAQVFTIEVTFTLAQANNDIVDDLAKLAIVRKSRPANVLLLSSSTCGPLESAAASTVLSFDAFLKDLLSKVPLAILSLRVCRSLLRAVHQSRQISSQCKTQTFPATKTLPSCSSLTAC
jgi:hypothetical protein